MNPVLVAAEEALLFVTDMGSDTELHALALDEALRRMSVTAVRRRVVALAQAPRLGARWQIRVTPCLLLDLGSRQIRLPGDPARLDASSLEQALAQR
jgi:hypothetical protein